MTTAIKELDQESFSSLIEKTDKLVIVEFYTTTCPNCRAIEPVYQQLSKELQDKAEFTRVNAQFHAVLASSYGVRGVPTFKFFCKGRPVWEIVGAVNETILRNTIKDLIRHRLECVSRSTPLGFEFTGYG